MNDQSPGKTVSEHVTLALRETARRRAAQIITDDAFTREIHRIENVDLAPHGYTLLVRTLENGTIRFLVKGQLGVCGMIDCDGETTEL